MLPATPTPPATTNAPVVVLVDAVVPLITTLPADVIRTLSVDAVEIRTIWS